MCNPYKVILFSGSPITAESHRDPDHGRQITVRCGGGNVVTGDDDAMVEAALAILSRYYKLSPVVDPQPGDWSKFVGATFAPTLDEDGRANKSFITIPVSKNSYIEASRADETATVKIGDGTLHLADQSAIDGLIATLMLLRDGSVDGAVMGRASELAAQYDFESVRTVESESGWSALSPEEEAMYLAEFSEADAVEIVPPPHVFGDGYDRYLSAIGEVA